MAKARMLGIAIAFFVSVFSVGTAQGRAMGKDVTDAAGEANVDPVDLLGALNTTGIDDPKEYLRGVGELADDGVVEAQATVPVQIPNARVKCIEMKESGGANVANRRGSGAGGVMQYMDSTFAAHAREMGHPEWSKWVPWQAEAVAAHDLALGRRGQWVVGGC